MTTKEALSMAPLKPFGQQVMGGIQTGLSGAVVSGVGIAAQKAFEALTTSRDMRQMMANPYNKDLKEHHERDPAAFNAAFVGLRKANIAMAQNPMTAGTYVRRMMTYDPSAAGGVLLDAMQLKEKGPGVLQEAFHEGGRMGVSHTFQEHLRDQGELGKEQRRPGLEADILRETATLRNAGEQFKLDHGAKLRREEATTAHGRNQELADRSAFNNALGEQFKQDLTINNTQRRNAAEEMFKSRPKQNSTTPPLQRGRGSRP